MAQRAPTLLAHFLRRAIARVVLNEQSLIARLRRRNIDLQSTLDTLRATTHRLNQPDQLTRPDELPGLATRPGFQIHRDTSPPHHTPARRGPAPGAPTPSTGN